MSAWSSVAPTHVGSLFGSQCWQAESFWDPAVSLLRSNCRLDFLDAWPFCIVLLLPTYNTQLITQPLLLQIQQCVGTCHLFIVSLQTQKICLHMVTQPDFHRVFFLIIISCVRTSGLIYFLKARVLGRYPKFLIYVYLYNRGKTSIHII